MKTPIGLFYLTNVKYGGFATYTAHLLKALRQCGYDPMLMKVGKRSEDRVRSFMHGEHYRNVSLQEALMLADTMPCHIVCAYWKQKQEATASLLRRGVSITIHDHTEFNQEMFHQMKHGGAKVVAIREPVEQLLKEKGVDVRYIPHPYVMCGVERRLSGRAHNAVSISRVDFDKHTEIIVEANHRLQDQDRVHIYGYVNRMYEHTKLKDGWPGWPNWRDQYRGAFDTDFGTPARIAASANYMVDMSVIAGDGGGTQYTFLEAIEAGAQLVVHGKWVEHKGVINEETARIASTPGELVDVLRSPVDEEMNERALCILDNHEPSVVVPMYTELF